MRKASKLLTDKEFVTFVNGLNNEYLYWDKVKHKKAPKDVDAETVWASLKVTRLIQEKPLPFGKFFFTYNLTDHIQRTLHLLDMNIGGRFGSESILPNDTKEQYLVSSIMEEAIASSQIEGAVTTRKQAKEMLRKGTKPRNISDRMIVNNYDTIQHIVASKKEPLTHDRLLHIHQLITNQTLDDPKDEGIYRTNNNIHVVDSTDNEIVYTPPDHSEIPSLMNTLIRFCNDEDKDQFIHPIVKGCIIHFMVGFIHPFVDGNGRTARALFYWYLLKNGYWLTEYLSISRLIVKSKVQYAKAYLYSETDDNDLTYFIHYKLNVMSKAFDSLNAYIQRKIEERKTVIQFQRIVGVHQRQAQILKWFYEEPKMLLTVKEIQTRFGVSNQTSRNDLDGLVALGYLDVVKMDGKTKAFTTSSQFSSQILEASSSGRGA